MRDGLRTPLSWVVSFLLVVSAAGCRDDDRVNRQKPGGELYQMWSASGERIIIETPSGDPAYKLRKRSGGWKVYDEDLVPVGLVRAEPPVRVTASGDGRTDEERVSIRVERIDSTETETIRRRGADVWELAGALRLERTAEGWAVYDADAEWIGRFYRAEGSWRLARGRHEESTWRVRHRRGRRIVEHRGEPVYRTWEDEAVVPVLLALGLEELELLHRVAVGAWLRRIAGPEETAGRSESGETPG